MDGYTAWKLHRAIKFHLLSLKYDVFAHNGATKNSEISHFLKLTDRKIFEFIGKQFERPNDAVQFFVANIAYSGGDVIRDFSLSWDNYKLWMKHKESMTKTVKDQIELVNFSSDLNGNPPKLLTDILAGRILPETAVAINRYVPFIDTWLDKDYFGSGKLPCIIKKLDRFVKFNTETIVEAITEQLSS
jgi:hypothetical protein